MEQLSVILQERYEITVSFDYSDIVSARQNAVPVRILKDSLIRKHPVFRRLLHPNDKVKAARLRPKSSVMKQKYTCLRCNATFYKAPKKLIQQKGRCRECGWFFKNITDKRSPLVPALKNWGPRRKGRKRNGSNNSLYPSNN